MRLQDRTALVTGGAQGIGAAIAALFAREGAAVAVADIAGDVAQDVAGQINAAGGRAMAVSLDVASETAWQAAMAEVTAAFGRLDVLINGAGLFHSASLIDSTVADFDRLCDVNLKGVFLGCRYAVAEMKDRDPSLPYASIVNVSSTAGFVGTSNSSIYTLTKGGVRLLSKAVAVEVGEAGYPIRCNSLHPGGTDTPMNKAVVAARGLSPEEFAARMKRRNLLGRIAQPDEIAAGALFLASDESSFMTGTELAIDGGYAAR